MTHLIPGWKSRQRNRCCIQADDGRGLQERWGVGRAMPRSAEMPWCCQSDASIAYRELRVANLVAVGVENAAL
jgi:hypothetical protein